ncbi:DUF7009 family protein [Chitinophaga lutea]
MKIRIRGNSIRYRLDKADIAALGETGRICETTAVGTSALRFFLAPVHDAAPSITAVNNDIRLNIPSLQLEDWTATALTGFELHFDNPDGTQLKILVEKDFKCLTVRDEDERHAFDNPLNGHTC